MKLSPVPSFDIYNRMLLVASQIFLCSNFLPYFTKFYSNYTWILIGSQSDIFGSTVIESIAQYRWTRIHKLGSFRVATLECDKYTVKKLQINREDEVADEIAGLSLDSEDKVNGQTVESTEQSKKDTVQLYIL